MSKKDDNSKQPDLFSARDARDARDEGMDRVMIGEAVWAAKAQRMAADAFPSGWVGLFEEVRRELIHRGIEAPHVYQCWSALCAGLLKRGIFERVNDWGQPTGVASHSSAYRKIRRSA